ncbi:MAG: hypothetical protein GY798_22180 [Hyphomicrobiales bacterium]|nr:hypothetical protein [Hyphomicrobiales bacterium]
MSNGARAPLARYADPLAWGTLVVAAILWFAAFVALFRRDLGDPVISAAVFAGVGILVFLAGQGAKRLSQREVE